MIANVNRLSWAVDLVVLSLAGHASAAPAPSENATINLIRLLVQQGVLKQDQADGLIAADTLNMMEGAIAVSDLSVGDVNLDGHIDVLTNDSDPVESSVLSPWVTVPSSSCPQAARR